MTTFPLVLINFKISSLLLGRRIWSEKFKIFCVKILKSKIKFTLKFFNDLSRF